ncbi:hypothetical protein QE152_g36497 [Popillia japonica]|uniref:Pre-C2HC domain-containing protein n=1 Tax=Popillia japonica TaxID=7064 RepID=A0AAW1IDM8_POPJA
MGDMPIHRKPERRAVHQIKSLPEILPPRMMGPPLGLLSIPPPLCGAFAVRSATDERINSRTAEVLPSHVAGSSNEITVVHSQSEALPMSGSTREQRRFPPNPPRPVSAIISSQPQSRQPRGKNTADPPPPTTPAERIPPVVLRDKTGWSKLSAEIKRRKINFTNAQNVTDGIRIFPSTASNHRTLTKFFSNDGIPHHTYQLPSEKLLNVVLRGIPLEIAEEEIFNVLRERGFTPEVVVRMRRSRDRAPMPLVLVKVPREQKTTKNYHLEEVLSLEALKAHPSIGQSPRKCVACAGDHEPGACPRPKQVPATCANCGEEHPANYRDCARFPKLNSRQIAVSRDPAGDGQSGWRVATDSTRAQESSGSYSVKKDQANNGRSYSQVLSNTQRTHPQGKTSKSPKVGFISGRPSPPPRNKPVLPSGDEDAKVEILLDALQSLFSQIEKITEAIHKVFPRNTGRRL